MICPKCNFDNPSEASYCMNCGTRLDGKVMCPNCRSLVSHEAETCSNCGTKIPCDKDLEVTEKDVHFINKRERQHPVWNIVLTAVFTLAFLTAVILSFGRVINVPVVPHKSIFNDDTTSTYSALYYLIFQWKDVRTEASLVTDTYLFNVWFLPVFRCVAVSINIVVTFVASIFGIVIGVKELKKKRECKFRTYLLAAIVLTINAMTLAIINSTYYGISDFERTTTGEISNIIYIFSTILLVAMAYHTYYTYDKNKKSLFIQKIIFSFSVMFALAIIAYLGKDFLVFNVSSISFDRGISYTLVDLIGIVIKTQNSTAIATLSTCGISTLIGLFIRVTCGALLVYFINGFFSNKEDSIRFKLPVYCGSIVVFVLSFSLFIMGMITALLYKGYLLGYTMENFDIAKVISDTLKCSVGDSIISTVTSAFLMLGCSMASFFIVRAYKKNMKIIDAKKTFQNNN